MQPQLLLTYDFPPIGGGIARWTGELARHYPRGSLIVSTGFHPESSVADRQFPNQIDRLPTRAKRLRTLPGLLRWSKRAADLADSSAPEFTWCGNLKPAGYPAKWLATRLGIPYGILVHGGELLIMRDQVGRSGHKRRTIRSLLKSASVLVANSRWTAEQCRMLLATLGLDTPTDKVRVVPLGTDPDVFRPGLDVREVRERYGLTGRRWLMTVARLTPHKGIDVALQVIAQLAQSYPDLGYVIIGFGPELSALQGVARNLGVADRVLFLTDVPDRDLPALYNCAEVYLGLSRQMTRNVEGFGIAFLEAGACGLPVVGGHSGGVPDAVREGETGILVDPETAGAAVTAVRELLDNRSLARRLGEGGRRAVETYFNWSRVAADLGQIGHDLGRNPS